MNAMSCKLFGALIILFGLMVALTGCAPEPAVPDARARRLLVTEIQGLESLLAFTPQSAPDRPKILRRLAENSVALEMVYEQSARISDAQAARRKAIEYYEELLEQYPQGCQSQSPNDASKSTGCGDEVLYFLADELKRDGDLVGARKTYLALLASYPQSRFVPKAHFAIGQMFFDEAATDPSKLPLAEQSYIEALKHAPSDDVFFGYAQIQLGRVRAKKGDRTRAAEAFKAAVAWAAAHPSLLKAGDVATAAQRELAALGVP